MALSWILACGQAVAGTVTGWGRTVVFPPEASGATFIKIASGGLHAVALKNDGHAVAWGLNDRGQCTVPSDLTDVRAIAAGVWHSMALKEDGTVVAWGDNTHGQCSVPVNLDHVVSIAAGNGHSMALKDDGTVVAWGYNVQGQCNIPGNATGAVAIAAGGYHSMVLKNDGTIVVWGWNDSGQCNIPGGLSDVAAIAGGWNHSLALKNDGTVIAWGGNQWGQSTVPEALTEVVSISAGPGHSLAVHADHHLSAWGRNDLGQISISDNPSDILSASAGGTDGGNDAFSLALTTTGQIISGGDNTFGQTTNPSGLGEVIGISASGSGPNDSFSVALKADGTVSAWGYNDFGQATVPTEVNEVVAVSAGGYHVMALMSDHTVAVWGRNNFGQLNVPPELSAGNVIAISAGAWHNLALTEAGTVIAWGYNAHGQCSVPPGLDQVVAIAAGNGHSMALRQDGSIAAWGYNVQGQINIPGSAAGAVAIAAGGYHSLALKGDGTVVAWGWNNSGQCNIPSLLDNVVAISGGAEHSLAVKADGSVVGWGNNTWSQCVPPGGINGAISSSAGGSQSLVIHGGSPAVPVITWLAPTDITFGTPLSETQLNATATDPNTGNAVVGTFVYSPAVGDLLNVGNGQTLSVTFTPADSVHYLVASKQISINVLKAHTSLTLGASPSPSQLGQAVTFIATISPPGASGSVRFVEGASTVASSPLVNGQASFTTTALALGSHAIQVIYEGDAQFEASSAATIQIVKQTTTVVVRLIDSSGAPLSGGKAQYYAAGWHDIGLTDSQGTVNVELLAGNYTFSIDYGFGRVQKTQHIGTNPMVIFQTQLVVTRLINSTGDSLSEGRAQYYGGGWRDIGFTDAAGNVSIELLPGTYTFSIHYAFGRVQKSQNIALNSTVVFQTTRVIALLSDSTGNPLSAGRMQYYAAGWRDFGFTAVDGTASIELLPASYTFSVDYSFGRTQKTQNIALDPTVEFQTQRVIARLTDSTGNSLYGGKIQYYAAGWRDLGFTGVDGTASIELLPASYTFSVDYAFGRVQKTQNIALNSSIDFQTQRVVTRLIDSTGNPLSGGKAQYYAGGWRDIGLTGADGQVSVELLPAIYTFSVDYAYGRVQKSQNTGLDSVVTFQTGQVHSTSGACIQYYSSGWRTFTNDIELLPVSILFRFNDGTANANSTVVAGASIAIH